ncbi:hypothetical protein P3342_004068 [Pyrenophora teres f. teres]|nr:hypothetical protein P3342_004068 [Pyrenophora teres f. teres]
MPRLGSRKSRNGCLQCKARRVKCDEGRPCGACTRYRAECSLLGADNQSASGSETASPHNIQLSASGSPGSLSTQTDGYSPDPSHLRPVQEHVLPIAPAEAPAGVPTADWLRDMELMHHYSLHAHHTLPGTDEIKQIWGFAVPQEAFKFDFLLHSILAFSSNHLAYINPSRATYFRLAASAHQTVALTSLNKAITDIGPLNCHAIFASAMLTVMNAFADARAYNLDVLVETFRVVRGVHIVMKDVIHILLRGPLALIIKPVGELPKPPSLLSTFLVEIQALGCSLSTDSSPCGLAIVEATEQLRIALQYSLETTSHPALRAIMVWPISLQTEFLEALKERGHPDVRRLFKYYCKLLEYASSEFWFLSNWRGISEQL